MSLKKYFQDSAREFNNITWPTRKQAIRITIIVFIFMIITAIFLAVVDYVFSAFYQNFL